MKLFCKENFKFLFTIVIITLISVNGKSKNFLTESYSISLDSESSELLKLESGQIYQSTPFPKGIVNYLHAYTYIYPDDPIKEVTLDSVTVENGELLIYKPTPDGETTKIIISLKELSWLCGKSLLCKPDETLEKLDPKGKIQKADLKEKIRLLYKKLGPDSTNCVADQFNFGIIQKAVILCFKSSAKEVEFNNLFTGLDKKDTESSSLLPLDIKKPETHLLSFSDGREALSDIEVTFKNDGLYDKTNLMFKYNELENIDGQKCQIKYRLPIAPSNFIGKKIFNKNCICRFKYNKLDTYVGSASANCEEVMKYVISKMKSHCLEMKNGQNNVLQSVLVAKPTEAQWKGMIFYHKILEEKNEVNKLMHKLFITPEKVSILDKDGHEMKTMETGNITWLCNNDGACSIPEYVRYLKAHNQKTDEFDKIQKDMKEQWLLQDTNSCYVITETDAHIICPTDNSEELNMKLALSVAIDKLYADTPISLVKPAPLDSEFKIVYAVESDTTFKDYDVLVTTQGLKNKKDKTNILEYQDIEKINNAPCAFIMRDFPLPNSFHEYDSNCCAKFKGKETTVFCIQKKAKCFIEIRKMVQLMHTNCKKVIKDDKEQSGTPDAPSDVPAINAKDLTVNNFKGDVVYSPLGNHKYKGAAVSIEGTIEVNANKIILVKKDGTPHLQYPIVGIRLLCNEEFTCTAEQYIKNQHKYLSVREREWLENHFTNFFNNNKNLKKVNCSVIIATNEEFNVSEGVIACSPNGQGEQIRAAITTCNSEGLSKLIDDHPQLNIIPVAPNKSKFEVEICSVAKSDDLNKAQSTKTKVINIINGIRYQNINEFIIEYKEIYDPTTFKIDATYTLDDKTIPPVFLQKKIDPKCCFRAASSANIMFICLLTKKRCAHDKAILYMHLLSSTKKLAQTEKKKQETDKMIEAEIEASGGSTKRDPFNFGLKTKFRSFPAGFSYISLSSETIFNAEAGQFKGWIYENNLTDRDYKVWISPVHLTLQDGKLDFRTELTKKPYKTLDLKNFDSVCPKPCMPKEYLKAVQETNSVGDKVYLNKCITNVMGQIFKPFSEQACSILDFKDPVEGFGTSIILCTIDELQGNSLRGSLQQGIYSSFRNLDIEKQVRNISWSVDKFYAILMINDTIDNKYNEFMTTKEGLVGTKQGSIEKFNIEYSKIREDSFGNNCAMWYKNIKVNERGDDYKEAVKDNNCCFRFYYGPERKKIELCVFVPGDGLCVKQSRELMKSLKQGCIINTGELPPDDSKGKKDAYAEETFDDNTNGIFDGFIHLSDAFNPSVLPEKKPKFIKVTKKEISIKASKDDPSPELTINFNDLIFSCEGYSPCGPKDFLTYAGTNKEYIPNLAAISGVQNNYRSMFPKLSKTFESDCFVLETKAKSHFVCPYNIAHASSIKKAIVQAFSLSYQCKTLNDVPNSKPDTKFNLVIKGEKPKETIEAKVTGKGLINTKDNSVVFDYLSMASDPETKKRCAIWFKDVDIPFEFEHKECCFNIIINSKNLVICLDEKHICIPHTFELMKSIYNGCLYGITNVPSLDEGKAENQEVIGGDANNGTFVAKKKFEYDPKTMFYDIQFSPRDIGIFKPAEVKNDYMIDADNRLMFSVNKSSFQGYFNVYPIDFEVENPIPLRHYYGILHGEHMKFFKNKWDKTPALTIYPNFLSMSCSSESACTPKEFGDFIAKFDKKYDLIKDSIEKKMVMYESSNDDGCVVLEHTARNNPHYYIVCIHVTNVKSSTPATEMELEKLSYTPARNMVASLYGKSLRKIIYDSNSIARKFIDNLTLPVDIVPIPAGKATVVENGAKVLTNIAVTQDGLTASGKLIFKSLMQSTVELEQTYYMFQK